MDTITEKLLLFIGVIAVTLFFAVIMAFPTMWLWNMCLEPAVEGVNPVSFWQALGLNFLFSILFKSNSSTKKE